MSKNYELVAGDGGSVLRIAILDSLTQEAVDLTGKTVQLRYSLNGGATVEKVMTPMDQVANKGKAQYVFLVGDISAGGAMTGEARIQPGQSDQMTTVDSFHLAVKYPLP